MVRIEHQIFLGKQNIPWKEVETYLKQYVGKTFAVKEYSDEIIIAGSFPNEYIASKYSQRLKGAVAKAKANVVQGLERLIQEATNRRYTPNKAEKHKKDAKYGWYRYDVKFELFVRAEEETVVRRNLYKGTMVVRINDAGLFLHDIINIKKEARTPLESEKTVR